MASTYSPLLRLELMTTGEKNGQWGDITNTNLSSILEQAIAGTVSISVTGVVSPITLTENYGTSDQSRTAILSITGTNASTVSIVAPAVSKLYYVSNASDQAVIIKTAASSGATVPAGAKQFVFYDVSTSDFEIATPTGTAGTVTSVAFSTGTTGLSVSGSPITTSGTFTLGGTLAIANGGTGAFTQGGAINNLLPSQAGQSGKFLTTNGSDVSWATAGSGGVGTVTSVQLSGGSTGMVFTGGPITTSGTMTMGGTLGVGFGGTGATTASGARSNLGLGTLATQNSVNLSTQTTGLLAVSALSIGSSGQVLTMSGSTPIWANPSGGGIVTTQRLSLSGQTVVTVTDIPSNARRVIILFDSVSTTGAEFYIALRTSGSGTVSGNYYGSTASVGSVTLWSSASSGVRINPNDNGNAWGGAVYFDAADANTSINIWSIFGTLGNSTSSGQRTPAGFVDLPAAAVNGATVYVASGSFDSGSVTIAYEVGSG